MTSTLGLHLGRVIVSLPYHNQYLVDVDNGRRMAIDISTGGGGRRGGHHGGGAYLPGAWVMVAVVDYGCPHARLIAHEAFILGSLEMHTIPNDTDFMPASVVFDSNADLRKNPITETLLNMGKPPVLNQDRSYGRPTDVTPGDFLKTTAVGGLLLLSEFFAKIGASPRCLLTFHYLNDRTELRTHDFLLDTETIVQQIWHRGSDSLGLEDMAFNVQEGLGLIGGGEALVLAEDPDMPARLRAVWENQMGYFRRRVFKGGSVEGEWDTVSTALESAVNTPEGQLFPGVLSAIMREDGIYRVRAAKEIRFEKTGAIPVPQQKAELVDTDRPEDPEFDGIEALKSQLDDIQQRQDAFGLTADEVLAQQPLRYEQYAEFEEQSIFFRGLRRDKGIWVLPTAAAARAELMGTQQPKLPVLPAGQQEYAYADLESFMTEAAELYPGRKMRLFRNSSVFLMAEDGGVVLGDGFGGEIRMHRGKVTITSVGDIMLAPGRDLIEMVPGNRIAKCGDRVEFSSTRGSVAIKAQENLQLISGNESTGGMMTLENRARPVTLNDITAQQLQQGEPIGSGIMFKSHSSGVSILSRYLYVGGYGQPGSAGISPEGVAPQACDIWLNAGVGNALFSAERLSLQGQTSLSLAMSTTLTGLYLNPSYISMVARNGLFTATPLVTFDRGSGQQIERVNLTNNGLQSTTQSLPQLRPSVVVQGTLVVAGEVQAAGSVVSEKGVVANDGCNPAALSGTARVSVTKPNTQAQLMETQVRLVQEATQTLLQTMVAQGLSTAWGQQATDFAFPLSDSPAYRAKNFSLLGYRWQLLLQTSATWVEKAMQHSIVGKTYPYPGKEVYEEEKKVLAMPVAGGVENKTMVDYPINLT